MQRQTKTVKFIVNMYQDLTENNKRKVIFERNKIVIYSMWYRSVNELVLQHFDELTLIYNLKDKDVSHFAGYSVSDKNTLNTVLDLVGYDQNYMFRMNPYNEIYLDGPRNEIESNFNDIDFIAAYEKGELSEIEIIEGFQELINSEEVFKLGNDYIKKANELLRKGVCSR
ncbi:DUF7417 domain-containing protein [Priestia megaterium]|uniref:DUF7417 domain-containing protein n=1 Tax=Priestia megaterium TaxID=1404 RepID=UPI00211BD9AC|nr:hypothetical protein [Priestia megaterium]